jgi:hypothetical protein
VTSTLNGLPVLPGRYPALRANDLVELLPEETDPLVLSLVRAAASSGPALEAEVNRQIGEIAGA